APAYAQSGGEITQADVDSARAERNAAASSLAATTARFEQAVVDEASSKERIAELARSVSSLEIDIVDRRTEVRDLVRERYMTGGMTATDRLFAAKRFEDIPIQGEYFALMSAQDHVVLNGLQAAEAHLKDRKAELEDTLTAQQELVLEITALRDDILSTLESADAAYNSIAVAFAEQEERKRREEEERKRREDEARRAALEAATSTTTVATTTVPGSTSTTAPGTTVPTTTSTTTTTSATTTTTRPPAPPPVVTDGKTCPVNAATSFSDTWGAGRSGGRSHKGVDMMAVRNAPLVAIETGLITRTSNSSLGGLSIYLTGDSGARYYYAHLEAWADGIGGGTSVSVGQLVGYNGTSGNAPDWLPHLHFQYAPPGSDWVDPYPLVKALCG
ncbi:MAG: peptidoglycan DD-metalloendopeptidase family protein, partial [Acidimicrobiia bacterium]|nr:peptidoglycan DD-metalloendopeptidase family protein [Acidimicrobiia bacterium]